LQVWSLGSRSIVVQIDMGACRFSPGPHDHLMTGALRQPEPQEVGTMSLIRLIQNIGHRVVAHYSPVFEPLDASAQTIWPNVPEETDPPRWRFDFTPEAVDPRMERAQAQSVRSGETVGILHA
jgi:hypothetical protein